MALTAEQQAELIKFQNPQLLEAESLEAAKELLSSEFIKKAEVHKDETIVGQIIGSRIGKLDTALNQLATANGLEFDENTKKAKIEDKISFVFESTKKMLSEKDELLKGKGGDELKAKIEAEYKQKIEGLTKELSSTKDLLTHNTNEFNTFKSNVEVEKKNFRLTNEFENARKKISLSPEAKPLEIKGFETTIKDKYVFDLNENGEAVVMLKETGKQIPNDKQMGTFMNIEQILQKEAEELRIHAKAPAAGKKTGTFTPQPAAPSTPTASSKRISPRAMGTRV